MSNTDKLTTSDEVRTGVASSAGLPGQHPVAVRARPAVASRTEASARREDSARGRVPLTRRTWFVIVGGALLPLLGSPTGSGLLIVLMLGLCLFNYWAGSRMGAPYAVPRNRAFLVAVVLSALFLTGSIAAAGVGQTWLVWACAGGTVVSYAVGSLVHYRGTRK